MNFSNTSFQKLRRIVRFYFRLQLYSAQIKRLFDFILWNFNKLIFFHTARENKKPHSSSKKRNSLILFCRNISFTRKEDYFIICLRISWRVKKFRAQRLLVFPKNLFFRMFVRNIFTHKLSMLTIFDFFKFFRSSI